MCIGSWWTLPRVREYLIRYREIAETLSDYGAGSSLPSNDGSRTGATEPGWCHLIAVKADLDRAIASLQGRDRRIAMMRWVEGREQSDVGRSLRVSQQRISSVEAQLEKKIADILG